MTETKTARVYNLLAQRLGDLRRMAGSPKGITISNGVEETSYDKESLDEWMNVLQVALNKIRPPVNGENPGIDVLMKRENGAKFIFHSPCKTVEKTYRWLQTQKFISGMDCKGVDDYGVVDATVADKESQMILIVENLRIVSMEIYREEQDA